MAAHAFRAAHCGEKIIPCHIVFDFGLSGVTFLTPTSAFHSISSSKTFCPRSKDPEQSPAAEAGSVGASPERRQVQGVLNKLKAVERSLNKSDMAFLRAEFLSYFE